jgi:hypothetical protein
VVAAEQRGEDSITLTISSADMIADYDECDEYAEDTDLGQNKQTASVHQKLWMK